MTQIDKSRFEWIGSDSARREGISRPSTTFWKDAIGRLMKNKVAVVCFFIIVLLILSCIVVPFFSPFESREQHLGEVNKGFMTVCTDSRYEGQHHVHYFGTDNLGRDLFLRAFEGGRVSLMIAFAAVFVNLIVGLIYGGISGYIGGAVDTIMMRIVEIVNGIPYLIVVILLMMVLPKGIFTMVVAYGITGWTGTSCAWSGAPAQEPGIYRGGRSHGRKELQNHCKAPHSECAFRYHHQRHPRNSERDFHRGIPFLHRSRCSGSAAVLGRSGKGRSRCVHDVSVPACCAGSCHQPYNAFLQPVGRRPARCI